MKRLVEWNEEKRGMNKKGMNKSWLEVADKILDCAFDLNILFIVLF